VHPFWDPSVLQTNYVSALPDPLRLKTTGVQPHQAQLYEDFGETISIIRACSVLTCF
jgi:hypothetical protein